MRVPSGLPQGQPSILPQGLLPRKAPAARPLDLAAIVVLPWLIFSLIVGLFAISYEDFAPLVWALVAASALLALLLVSVGSASGKAAQLALGLLTLTSVGVAVPVGLFVEYTYMAEYARIDAGAEYHRVSPAAPGALFEDASVLDFEPGSSVDVGRSLGFMRLGDVFCVAPIAGPGPRLPEAPQYWAAGTDCCASRGGFACGDVADHAAHGGVAVNDGTGAFHAAARMAAATYELRPPAGRPIFVRWTADAADYRDKLFDSALTLALVASGLHLVGSIAAGLLLSRSLLR